jgi:hypothetical protein
MMKATAPLLALAILVIAPSPALADPYRLHHDYYKLIDASPAGTTASNSVPWASIGAGFAIAALAALLLTRLQLNRRTYRTAP